MREDTNFKGSDSSCPSIYFLFYGKTSFFQEKIKQLNVEFAFATVLVQNLARLVFPNKFLFLAFFIISGALSNKISDTKIQKRIIIIIFELTNNTMMSLINNTVHKTIIKV